MPTVQAEIERYLSSGEHDQLLDAWPGHSLVERAQRGTSDLRAALLAEVRSRTAHAIAPEVVAALDTETFTRGKVTPMVHGLFPAHEQAPVLDMVTRSVVFLTPVTIDTVLVRQSFLSTAWILANIYLSSCGVPMLANDAPRLVGLSDATSCYLSTDYFEQGHRLDDYLVHEAAHVFHNCKRVTVGLPETRRCEWLLNIAFAKRETFAYACETYSRIVELAHSPAARRELLAEAEVGPMPSDERVDADEYLDILREAVAARNGWKRILARCSTQT